MKKIKVLLSASLLLFPMSVATPAQAVCVASLSTTATCCGAIDYTTIGSSTYMYPAVPVFKAGPGGTMSVSNSYSFSQSYSVEAGVTTEVDAVLAKAKATVNAGLVKTNVTTSTATFTHTVTPGMFGNMRYRVGANRVTWTKVETFADCSTRTTSGVIVYPTNTQGWLYWESTN